MHKLYNHQKKLIKNIRKVAKNHNHILVGSPTGSGKSVIMSHMIAKDLKDGCRVLVLAPYRKLVFQLEQTFALQEPHVIMGNIDRGNKLSGLVLSSGQTMNLRLKKDSKYFNGFDAIYIDEAHIGCEFPPKNGTMFKRLYDKYWNNDRTKWYGFTATPITAQGYRLGGWDSTIYRLQTAKLIDKGYLADYKYFAPEQLNLDKLRTRAGDYASEDIEEVTNTASAVKSVKKIWKKYAKNKKKCLIFASSIAHAALLHEAIGSDSLIIHSNIDESEQERILEQYKISKYGTLINVGMLTTGFDDPTVEMLILARPTKSIRLYMQIVGRVLRKHGKKVAYIYDMCSVYSTCGLPDDMRDFNRVKNNGMVKSDKDVVELNTVCDICNEVSPTNKFSKVRTTEAKFILTTWTCPNCGEICREVREDLSVVRKMEELKRQGEAPKLSFKERKQAVGKLVAKFTKAKVSWSHFIVQIINVTGRTPLLEQELAKDIKDYTKWRNIMKLYEASKNE